MFFCFSNYIFPRVARQKIIKLYSRSTQTKTKRRLRRRKKLFFSKLNSMIHERDRHIAHSFSWALNEVFYHSSSYFIRRKTTILMLAKVLAKNVFVELVFFIFSHLKNWAKAIEIPFPAKFIMSLWEKVANWCWT